MLRRCARPVAVAHGRTLARSTRPVAVPQSRTSPFALLRRRFSSESSGDNGPAFDDSSLRRIRDPFDGISAQPFPKEVAERLMAPIPAGDIEIRPDGLIYLPEIKYRRILNTAIGPGGWSLMPRAGTAIREETSYSREFALFCFGRFVAQARGEQVIGDRTQLMSLGFLDEAAKSNALMRCCKDLGVASELWDPGFISDWKAKYAVDVWVEHVNTKAKRKLWRRKDRPPIGYPFKEIAAPAAGDAAVKDVEAPPVQTADTFAPSFTPLSTHRPRIKKDADLGSSSSASSSDAASASSSSSSSSAGGEFDMNATVPAAMKKVAGKTWAEVTSTDEGRKYIKWMASNEAHVSASIKKMAKKALEMHDALASFDNPDAPPTK